MKMTPEQPHTTNTGKPLKLYVSSSLIFVGEKKHRRNSTVSLCERLGRSGPCAGGRASNARIVILELAQYVMFMIHNILILKGLSNVNIMSRERRAHETNT